MTEAGPPAHDAARAPPRARPCGDRVATGPSGSWGSGAADLGGGALRGRCRRARPPSRRRSPDQDGAGLADSAASAPPRPAPRPARRRRLGRFRQPRRELRQLDGGRADLGRCRSPAHAAVPHGQRGGRLHPRTTSTILDTSDPVLHLLRRTTFGPTPALVDEVHAAGIDGWLAAQLAPTAIHDPFADQAVAAFPLAGADPATIRASITRTTWDAMIEYSAATLARQMWSNRQLYEVMVDFWANHLNAPDAPAPAAGTSAGPTTTTSSASPCPRHVHRHAAGGRAAPVRSCATSPPPSPPRSPSTRTSAASCSSCTRWAWPRATPRTTCATAPTSSRDAPVVGEREGPPRAPSATTRPSIGSAR